MTKIKTPSVACGETNRGASLQAHARLLREAGRRGRDGAWISALGDDSAAVVLKDPEKHCSVTISHKAWSFDQDFGVEDSEHLHVPSVFGVLANGFGIELFERVGFRRRVYFDAAMPFPDLAKVLSAKFFQESQSLRKAVPQRLEDLSFQWVLRDGERKLYVGLGPATKQELRSMLPLTAANFDDPLAAMHMFDECPAVSVFMDVDASVSDPTPANRVAETISELRQSGMQLVDSLHGYIFGA